MQKFNELKTSLDHYKEIAFGIEILDPNGWDKENFSYSFYIEKISEEVFSKRMADSLCCLVPITRKNESVTQKIVREIHEHNNYF